MLFKTLVDGRSCHGGSLEWSLPHDGQPGKWHEVDGDIIKCESGIHVTDAPAHWWKPGCMVYVVECDGVVGSCDDNDDRKIVCRRTRLLREATAEELDAQRIWSSGAHAWNGKGPCIVSDSATVRASDSATVRAWGSATVRARADVTVISWRGSDAINLTERAVCIDRSNRDEKPRVITAED